jgi:hypothetical protein
MNPLRFLLAHLPAVKVPAPPTETQSGGEQYAAKTHIILYLRGLIKAGKLNQNSLQACKKAQQSCLLTDGEIRTQVMGWKKP